MGSSAHSIDVQIVSKLRAIPGARAFRNWLRSALPQPTDLTIRIVNAAEGRNLNSAFRGKDYATNVLTFVYHEKKAARLMGDIVLCAPVVVREAREQGKSLEAHYAHLTVHGALHLAGMNHENTREAKAMERKETTILNALGFANPYAEDSEGQAR